MNVQMKWIREINEKQELINIRRELLKSRATNPTVVELRDRKLALTEQKLAEL